jgi:hypothetical protein
MARENTEYHEIMLYVSNISVVSLNKWMNAQESIVHMYQQNTMSPLLHTYPFHLTSNHHAR